jgi:hypothetical protein
MGARKDHRPPGSDRHVDLAAYAQATRRADAWARRSVARRELGYCAEADRAEQRALYWLRRATMIAAPAGIAEPAIGPDATAH